MRKYQVELAVCLEDNTWVLENVKITFPDTITEPTEGEIWEVADEVFMRQAGAYWKGRVISCTGLFHIIDEREDNP